MRIGCETFSGRGISFSRFRIRGWRSRRASIANSRGFPKRPAYRSSPPTIATISITTMSDTHRMKFATDQFYFKTAAEMAKVFGEVPEALSRTVEIASRCNVKIERIPNPFPEFKVPEGHTSSSYFEKVVREGFALRVPQLERLAKQNALANPLVE